MLWLEATLQAWPKTLLIVSHARDFLNSVCTDVVHLFNRKLTHYRGNFDSFEAQLAERNRCAEKRAEAAERKKKHMQAFLDKFGALLRQRAKLVQNRMQRMEAQIDRCGIVYDDPDYCFRFPEPPQARRQAAAARADACLLARLLVSRRPSCAIRRPGRSARWAEQFLTNVSAAAPAGEPPNHRFPRCDLHLPGRTQAHLHEPLVRD